MRLASAGVSGRGAVAGHHRPRPPPGQAHQVHLGAGLGKPLVGEGMAELVEVRQVEAGATCEQSPYNASRPALRPTLNCVKAQAVVHTLPSVPTYRLHSPKPCWCGRGSLSFLNPPCRWGEQARSLDSLIGGAYHCCFGIRRSRGVHVR
jgi:hypothetical protein